MRRLAFTQAVLIALLLFCMWCQAQHAAVLEQHIERLGMFLCVASTRQ